MSNLIKLRYTADNKPYGAEHTYYTPVPVEVGNLVQLSDNGELVRGVVTQINVPESEAEPGTRTIYGLLPMSMQPKFKGECN